MFFFINFATLIFLQPMKTYKIIPLIGILLLTACSAEQKKERAINNLEKLVIQVESKSQNYNQEDWIDANAEFNQLITELDAQQKLSDDDYYRIGQLKARYAKAAAKQAIKETSDQLSIFLKEAEGFLDELASDLD